MAEKLKNQFTFHPGQNNVPKEAKEEAIPVEENKEVVEEVQPVKKPKFKLWMDVLGGTSFVNASLLWPKGMRLSILHFSLGLGQLA